MSKPLSTLEAIESPAESTSAFNAWRDHWRVRAQPASSTILWDDATRVAASFWRGQRDGRPVFWIAFAHSPVRFRTKLLVEVNPPRSGISTRFQGVFARGATGRRYVLHRGELHPGRERVKPDKVLPRCTVPLMKVRFSDDSSVKCALVAPLDEGEDRAVDATAQFVSDCANIRHRLSDPNSTWLEKRLFELEHASPELRGAFVIPAQEQRLGIRRHADVWHALHAALLRLNLSPANARLGLFGPDLYTCRGEPMVLFEIKAHGDSASLQQAVGQLFIYEQALARKVLKVLVVPSAPSKDIQRILGALQIRWIDYGDHAAPRIDLSSIASMIR